MQSEVQQHYLHKVIQAHALECPADVTQLPHKCVLLRPPVGYLTLQAHALSPTKHSNHQLYV